VVVTVGLIVIVVPAVETEPPQEPLYQYQFAPVLKFPPVIPNVVDVPGHIDDGVPKEELAGVEFIFTVNVTDVLLLIHCSIFHDIVICPLPV